MIGVASRLLSTNPEAAAHTLRWRGVAFRVRSRPLVLAGLCLVLIVLLGAWGMTLGSFPLPLSGVVEGILGTGSRDADFIIRTLRLPRVLVAVLVGAALALSGAVFQGLVRNPLVSPDIVGINAGATLLAVAWIVTGQPAALLPVVAFAGAVGAAALVYALTWQGGVAGGRLILVGIGANALFSAGTTFLIVRYPIDRVSSAILWATGTVYGADWLDVIILAGTLLILGPIAGVLMWSLRVLQLGDTPARSLGLPLERTRLSLVLVGCALSAVAVSAAGPVGFVAFMVPHVGRMLAGPLTGGVLLLTGVLGGLLLLGADMLGQHALPVSLPVGVITAALGAPYFLFLLYRMQARL